MSRPYDELMEKAECNTFALAEKIYQLGRADQKKEDNEFFNFEGAWELEKQKIRADAIDEMVNALGTEPFSVYVMEIVRHWAKKLKEQK